MTATVKMPVNYAGSTQMMNIGVRSAAEDKEVENDCAKVLNAFAEIKRIREQSESQQETVKLRAKLIHHGIELSVASILGINPTDVNNYVSEADLNRFAIANARLVVNSDIFRDVILMTFKSHPELKKCNLQVCDLQSMTYLTDLFKEIHSTKIEEIAVPRRLDSNEKMALMQANGKLIPTGRRVNLTVVV